MLSKSPSSTIFWVFGITQLEIELQSPGQLAKNLIIKLMAQLVVRYFPDFFRNATDIPI